MRIGFDGKRATQNFTGLGNYSRFVLHLLSSRYPQNDYKVFAIRKPSHRVSPEAFSGTELHYPPSGSFSGYWRSVGILRDLSRNSIQLFHGLSNEIPFGLSDAGIASVVTIHDLIFLRYPRYFSFINRAIYLWKVKYAIRKSDRIIAISKQTRQDLIDLLDTDPGKIDVVYQNCDPMFRARIPESDLEKTRIKYGLPDRYILNVGTIENRKNLLQLVKALKLSANKVKLVVVGRPTPYFLKVDSYIKQEGMHDRILFLKDVSYEDLPAIYQQAELFVYPSEFEGFGIPIVEALSSGIPVIGARGSCLEEAGGPASVYVNPSDPDELAFQIDRILNDKELQQDMVQKGTEHLKNFDEKQIADQLISIYNKTIYDAQRRSK